MRISRPLDRLLTYEGQIKGQPMRILIDSGASGNFISRRLAQRLQLATIAKDVPDTIRLADGHTVQSTHVSRTAFSLGSLAAESQRWQQRRWP
jgi:predicted aspartyl protease